MAVPLQSQERPAAAAGDRSDAEITRFETGVQSTDLRTGCIGKRDCYLPSAAVGVSGTLNLNPHFAIDANWIVTPSFSTGNDNFSGGRATQFLAGVRGEVRSKHWGYFLAAQPGVLHWNHVITAVDTSSQGAPIFTYGSVDRFVSAVGAGFEYSPTTRIHIRGSVSDLIEKQDLAWKNNLQPTVGVYFGVGKPIPFTVPIYRREDAHKFWDRTNVTLLVGSQLAATADSVTTYQFMQRGVQEGDPVVRPLVKYGVPGLISLQVVETGLEILGMYGLHRLGHHWIERALPICDGVDHAVFAYNNAHRF